MNDRIKTAIILLAIIFAISWIVAGIFKMGIKVGNVALIKINGPITAEGEDFLNTNTISSADIVKFIEDADENREIKAIFVEINSPGGSAVASAEIVSALKKTNKTKVALIREIGTSGAYWVASASDKIVAHPLSVTGSIGVLGSYLEFSKLLERFNITYERLVAGKYKDIGSPLKELSEDEKRILQEAIDSIQAYFLADVAKNRNLPEAVLDDISTGRIYIGIDAKKLGLVDVLGGKDEAEQLVKEMANITEITYVPYEKKRALSELLRNIFKETGFFVGKGIGDEIIKDDYIIKT